jgi:membrane protease YdiL (CAAX protease family)
MVLLFVSAGIALALAQSYTRPSFLASALRLAPDSPLAVAAWFGAVFLLLGVAPALLWRFALGRPLLFMGLARGDFRFGLKLLALALPLIVVPLAFISSRIPDLRVEYPLASGVSASLTGLLLYEGAYLLYYLGYEAFFRGFLLFGLERRIGPFSAVGVTTLVTLAFHMGKPEGEVWGALAAGLLFGWLALRTRSFLYPFVIHAAMGILLDVFVVAGPGSLRP